MFMQTNELIKMNLELTNIIKDSAQEFVKSLNKAKHKKVNRALLSYMTRVGHINSSILDAYASRNGYCIGILWRSMIEHSFRYLYIYTRALNEEDDAVGVEYYGKLKGSEDLASIRKISNYTKVVHPERTKWSSGGDHNKGIDEVGKKFEVSNIFFYLIRNFKEEEEFVSGGMKDYLLERLNQYTELSSYVHGGPYAEMCHNKIIGDTEKMNKNLDFVVRDSFELYRLVVETTYLFLSLADENFSPYYEKVHELGQLKTAVTSLGGGCELE
jgi:hypothetical protein